MCISDLQPTGGFLSNTGILPCNITVLICNNASYSKQTEIVLTSYPWNLILVFNVFYKTTGKFVSQACNIFTFQHLFKFLTLSGLYNVTQIGTRVCLQLYNIFSIRTSKIVYMVRQRELLNTLSEH